MGLFDRMGRVVRAQLNHWVGQAEDPEQILEQAVQDMQADLIQLRQAVAQAIATQNALNASVIKPTATPTHGNTVPTWLYKTHSESLAREALLKRKTYLITATALSEQLQQQQTLAAKLKRNLREMEPRLAEAKAKKELYIARARSAEASYRLREMLKRSSAAGAGAVFDRMETKVMDLEAQAEVAAELGRDPMAERFAALECDRDVEQTLEAMRRQIRSQNAPQLPRFD
ncbi:MAG: PspA/IM30 family protein [Synechococcales cyanobacterium RU_4_20]|nr:PspA/IM30 family protein [Synechococcales cyanobacterium RU_4_20]